MWWICRLLLCSNFIVSSCGEINLSDVDLQHKKPRNNANIRNTVDNIHTHVFKESIPKLSSRTDLLKRDRAHHDHIHEVIFVIQQRNMDELTSILHDVSDPSSPNYGLHWTTDEVVSLTSNPEASDAVVSYLSSTGVPFVSETLRGEFITASAPIKVWEKVFKTEFFIFHQTHHDERVEHLIRAEKYWIPRELDEHVGHVFNIVDMPIGARGNLPKIVRPSIVETMDEDPAKWMLNGLLTPYKLKVYCNMSNSVRGNEFSTQTIFASIGQNYSPRDMNDFQTIAGLPLKAVTVINGHSNHTLCLQSIDNCHESALDTQYIYAMSPSSPTTHRYTDGDFVSWLMGIATDVNPSRVLSFSYVNDEDGNNLGALQTWTTVAIKLCIRGVTIVSSSGDDGANSWRAQGTPANCGYAPLFPSVCPYVLSVGATSVSYQRRNHPSITCYECH